MNRTVILVAMGLVATALVGLPSVSAQLACAAGTVCAGTGAGGNPAACRYIGGTYPYECVAVISGCFYEWRDKSGTDGDPDDGNDWVITVVCA